MIGHYPPPNVMMLGSKAQLPNLEDLISYSKYRRSTLSLRITINMLNYAKMQPAADRLQ